MSLEFLLTSLILVLMPGTGVLYTIAIGLGHGFKASVAAALGCTFGIVPAAFASIIGLAAVFHTSAIAFLVIKYLGVVYLLYMAWSMFKDDGLLCLEEQSTKRSYWHTALNGTLLNVLNPKLSLFFLAFLPQFVPVDRAGSLLYMCYLAAVFMLMTFVVFVLYGAFASTARLYLVESPRVMMWLKRGFAGVFGFMAVKLALADR